MDRGCAQVLNGRARAVKQGRSARSTTVEVDVQERLKARLLELKRERAAGQKMLDELEEQRLRLTETMLRIDGAIQVIEEMLSPEEGDGDPEDA